METLIKDLTDQYLAMSIQAMNDEDNQETLSQLDKCKNDLIALLDNYYPDYRDVAFLMDELEVKINCVHSALILFNQPNNTELVHIAGEYYERLVTLYAYVAVSSLVPTVANNHYSLIKAEEKQAYLNFKEQAEKLGIERPVFQIVLQQFKTVCEHNFSDTISSTVYTEDLVEAEAEYIRTMRGKVVSLHEVQESKFCLHAALAGSCFTEDPLKYIEGLKYQALVTN